MPLRVAVNVSSVQFQGRELIDVVEFALSKARMQPQRLEIEITESVLLKHDATTLDLFRRLRQLGVSIAMDDFGTGYSSLSYLRNYALDKIKIDREFTRHCGAQGGAAAIVRAIANLAHSLGMRTIAEGVETEQQLARLREHGCDELQGYLFSPPVPADAVGALLARSNSLVCNYLRHAG